MGADWERAGLYRPDGDSLDRPMSADTWQVPNVIELDSDRLVWMFDQSLLPPVPKDRPIRADEWFIQRGPGRGMLDGFVRLADAPPKRIRNYARHWGVLGICEHGLPRSHRPPAYPLPKTAKRSPSSAEWGCDPMRCEDDGGPYDSYWFCEPLGPWWWFAGQARAVLNMIVAVQQGRPGSVEDVHAAHAGYRDIGWVPQSVSATQIVIAQIVDEWLLLAQVRPSFRWSKGESARISFSHGNLFGALGLALALRAAGADGWAICQECRVSYAPTRQPREGERNYCQSCRDAGIPQRDAGRNYRERKKEAQRAAKVKAPAKKQHEN